MKQSIINIYEDTAIIPQQVSMLGISVFLSAGLFNSGKLSGRVGRSQKFKSAHGSEDFEEPEELMWREVWEAEYHKFGCDCSVEPGALEVCEEGEERC